MLIIKQYKNTHLSWYNGNLSLSFEISPLDTSCQYLLLDSLTKEDIGVSQISLQKRWVNISINCKKEEVSQKFAQVKKIIARVYYD